MYYIAWAMSYPPGGRGYQETETLADAKQVASMLKRAKEMDEVYIVDALDSTRTSGYRVVYRWGRDGNRWRGGKSSGRRFV